MKIVLWFVIALAILSIISAVFYAIKKDYKQTKRLALSSVVFIVISCGLFFVFRITGEHRTTLDQPSVELQGAIITPKELVVDKDSRSVKLIVSYENTEESDDDSESLDNKDINLAVKQGSDDFGTDFDYGDVFIKVTHGKKRNLEFVVPTSDYKTDINWSFKQKDVEKDIVTKLN